MFYLQREQGTDDCFVGMQTSVECKIYTIKVFSPVFFNIHYRIVATDKAIQSTHPTDTTKQLTHPIDGHMTPLPM